MPTPSKTKSMLDNKKEYACPECGMSDIMFAGDIDFDPLSGSFSVVRLHEEGHYCNFCDEGKITPMKMSDLLRIPVKQARYN